MQLLHAAATRCSNKYDRQRQALTSTSVVQVQMLHRMFALANSMHSSILSYVASSVTQAKPAMQCGRGIGVCNCNALTQARS